MKLHLGCGAKYIPGWLHIDVADYPHVKLRHEVDSLPMLTDNSVSIIYSCHVLEHFMRREVLRVLKEWYRLLRSGGILRVAVPDFAAAMQEYQERGNLETIIGLLFGRQDGLYGFHHTVFDEKTLHGFLLEAGFKSAERYDWRQTEHAHIDDYSQAYLPHMNKDCGRLVSLNMEAVK